MNEVSSHVKLNKVESSSKNDIKYLLEVGNKQYFVGELIYFIIIQLQAKNTLEKISIDVNLKFKPDALLTGSDIQDIVNNNIKPLGVFEYNYDESKINTSVKAKITLLSAKTINRICSPIKYLFSPLSFFTITLFLVLLNLYFVFWTENPLIKFDYSSGGIITYLLIYPILIIITLIHELGHSAATLKFNVQPKSIGFGFYYLLPVLYTDISGIWRLSKMKKVIINLAGIYMQLLANGLIFITTLFLRNNIITNFLHYIVLANFSSLDEYKNLSDMIIKEIREERSELTPDLPTLLEKDINLVASVRRGIVVPKGTPEEIVTIIENSLQGIANDEEFIQDLENQGIDTLFLGQEDYKAYLEQVDTNTAKIADQLQ